MATTSGKHFTVSRNLDKKTLNLASPKSSTSSSSEKDISDWDTDDVLNWLGTEGLSAFKQGFRDQKIDGMCLKEGLTEIELNICQVQTVGEKRLVKRKISELVCEAKVPSSKKLKRAAVLSKSFSPQQKEDLLRRRKQVHRKTVGMFPGNDIPIFRGNASASRHLEELLNNCQDHSNPDIGYDEDEIRRHIKTILDERRRMVKEGYNYDKSSTDEESKHSNSPILIEDVPIKKECLTDDEISNESGDNTQKPNETDEGSDCESQNAKLPMLGGSVTMPLTTAETIILAYFNKGYTREVKKDVHLLPICRQFKIKNIKSKDKGELMILLAKELVVKKHVVLKDDADFYCLHRDSIDVVKK